MHPFSLNEVQITEPRMISLHTLDKAYHKYLSTVFAAPSKGSLKSSIYKDLHSPVVLLRLGKGGCTLRMMTSATNHAMDLPNPPSRFLLLGRFVKARFPWHLYRIRA